MARGKSRKKVTAALRDSWIEKWEKVNSKGKKYIPFIDPRDIKSDGSKGRIPDYENAGQDTRVLSNNERLFYLILLFDTNILSVKAQFPLLPIARSVAIAKHLKLRHPKYPYTSVDAVMTSDFCCGKLAGGQVVYSIKDDEQMEKLSDRQLENTLNKEKIQRAFWETQSIPFHLIYSSEFKKTSFASNLRKLAKDVSVPFRLELIKKRWLETFLATFPSFQHARLSELIAEVSLIVGISYQDSITIFQHFLWQKAITANLSSPLYYEKRVSSFELEVRLDG